MFVKEIVDFSSSYCWWSSLGRRLWENFISCFSIFVLLDFYLLRKNDDEVFYIINRKNNAITILGKMCFIERIFFQSFQWMGFPGGSESKESACNVGDLGSIPGLRRSPGGGHGNPLQCSRLEKPRGQKSLVGYSPWGCKQLDTTEQLSTAQGVNNSLFLIWDSVACFLELILRGGVYHLHCWS